MKIMTTEFRFTTLESAGLSYRGGLIFEELLENGVSPDYICDVIDDMDEDYLEDYITDFIAEFKWVDNEENRELICDKLKEEAMQ